MLTCNKERLQDKISTFSKFGDTGKGGITRLSLSPAALEAREEFCKRCKALGMEIKTDDMANIYATIPGEEKEAITFSDMTSYQKYNLLQQTNFIMV